ncbi:MAG TPA: DUF2269 family protein [Gaiellaceae bacterium]|jgi:uncharacterized membrane protein|nr:DUF2269 family protein [Gaiellaceae bacterium]
MEPTLTGAEAPTVRRGGAWMTPLAGAILLVGAIVFLWRAPGSYQIFKSLHIAFAVIWVGGGTGLTVTALVAQRENDTQQLLALGKQAAFLGEKIFTPASFVVLAFGIAMVEKVDWGWGTFWVDFALVVWALSTAIGVGYLAPVSKKLTALLAEKGPDDPEVRPLLDRLIGVARFDVVMLILIVIDMAAKPSF